MDRQSLDSVKINELTKEQLHFIDVLCERHFLDIPHETRCSYAFGQMFLDCFAYDQDQSDNSGYTRFDQLMRVVTREADGDYIAHKLKIGTDTVDFMARTITLYYTKPIVYDHGQPYDEARVFGDAEISAYDENQAYI